MTIALVKPPKLPPLPEYHNQKACQKCPGYCCKRFWMRSNKKRNRALLKDPMVPEESRICAKFLLKYFVRLRKRDNKGSFIADYAYTCKLFDDKLGRCMGYDKRPPTCKYFMCESGKGKKSPIDSPEFKDVHAWGRQVLARRKRCQGERSKRRVEGTP